MSVQIPEMMRAAVLRDPAEGLRIEQIRTPRPKEGEVLVKVSACGMCHSDLHVLGGAIAFPKPCVLGHEVAGEIVEVGPHNEYSKLAVGDKVAGAFLMPCGRCESCAQGRDDLCEPFFGLNRLKGRLGGLLADRRPMVVRFERPGMPTRWRLRTSGFSDAAAARSFCEAAKAKGAPACAAIGG